MRRTGPGATTLLVVAVLALGCASGVTPKASDGRPIATGEPTPSPGCGITAVRSSTTRGSMAVQGLERTWYLHVPPAHDGHTPLPLVVQLHGYGNDVVDMAVTGLDTLGDREGFVVATPVGRGSIPRWLFELDAPSLDVTAANPDIAFIGALIDRLGAELCLDTSRVYATGISNGAWLTSALPCALGDRIAAIAPVAGVVDFGPACHPDRPVPVLAFHGDADTVLPIEGGFGPGVLTELRTETGAVFGDVPVFDDAVWSPSVRERMAALAVRDGCQPDPVTEAVSMNADRLSWSCPPGADVQLVVVRGGWHDWPRPEPGPTAAPGATPRMIEATRLIWQFFSAHPLPVR